MLARFPCVFPFVVDISIENRESDKESDTNQVLDTFDVLVVIDQSEYFLYFTN